MNFERRRSSLKKMLAVSSVRKSMVNLQMASDFSEGGSLVPAIISSMKISTPLFLVSVLFLSACAATPAPTPPEQQSSPPPNEEKQAPPAVIDDVEDTEEDLEDEDFEDEDLDELDDLEETTPATLEGPAMPAKLQAFVAKKFPAWVGEWEFAAPDFALTEFVKGEDESLGTPYVFSLPQDEARDLFFVASPDGTQLAGITGADVTNEEDDQSIIFDVDSSIVTIDPATDQAKKWATYGPCCGFYDVAWLDGSTIVVAAGVEDSVELNGTLSRCPEDDICKESRILLFHLDTGVKEVYRGPLMSEDDFDSWWEDFWQDRFPDFEIF